MKSFRRAVLLAVALVASSLSLVTVSTAPAQAANYDATALLTANYTGVQHGRAVKFTGRVTVHVGTEDYWAPVGTATLQRLDRGASTWASVATTTITESTEDMTWSYKPSVPARYRLVYSGGTIDGDVIGPAESAQRSVAVARNLHDDFKKSSRTFFGKVTPSYAKRKVVIQRSTCAKPKSTSCKWKAYKTVKTGSTGKWSIKLPVYGRKKTHFRAVVAASNGYLKSYSNYYVSTWRS